MSGICFIFAAKFKPHMLSRSQIESLANNLSRKFNVTREPERLTFICLNMPDKLPTELVEYWLPIAKESGLIKNGVLSHEN